MIETIILDYLESNIDVPVYMEQPKVKPDTFVLIELTGGYRENYLNYATIAVQSYAQTLFNASELNEIIKTAMLQITDLKKIARCQLNGNYNYTDDSTKQYRYQAVFELVYYD